MCPKNAKNGVSLSRGRVGGKYSAGTQAASTVGYSCQDCQDPDWHAAVAIVIMPINQLRALSEPGLARTEFSNFRFEFLVSFFGESVDAHTPKVPWDCHSEHKLLLYVGEELTLSCWPLNL